MSQLTGKNKKGTPWHFNRAGNSTAVILQIWGSPKFRFVKGGG